MNERVSGEVCCLKMTGTNFDDNILRTLKIGERAIRVAEKEREKRMQASLRCGSGACQAETS